MWVGDVYSGETDGLQGPPVTSYAAATGFPVGVSNEKKYVIIEGYLLMPANASSVAVRVLMGPYEGLFSLHLGVSENGTLTRDRSSLRMVAAGKFSMCGLL